MPSFFFLLIWQRPPNNIKQFQVSQGDRQSPAEGAEQSIFVKYAAIYQQTEVFLATRNLS